jgi:uncharacterized protein (DUF58 family)
MTVPSKALLWVAALVVLPIVAVGGLYPQFFVISLLVIAALALGALLDAWIGRERLAGVGVRMQKLVRLTKDVPAPLPLVIDNGAQRPLLLRLAAAPPQSVSITETGTAVSVPSGASSVEWNASAVERGDFPVESVYVQTESPLGLWHVRNSVPVDCNLRVYPNLRGKATAALFQRNEAAGARLRRQIGKGREFDNLRQYIPGDAFEDVSWKATARRGSPVVKLYRVENAQEVYAVIDSSRLSMREGIIEKYVEAALHLALVAERQGDRFGLVTFSDRTHNLVRARRGLNHFRLCRETIYNLRATRVSPDFREVFTSLQLNLRKRALLVFFTSLDDALLAETFEREAPMLARRHLVLVNVMRTQGVRPLFRDEPPSTLDGLYGGLAGQILWNRLRKVQLALHSFGVKMTVVDPERILTQVAAQYLDVKRRQAL